MQHLFMKQTVLMYKFKGKKNPQNQNTNHTLSQTTLKLIFREAPEDQGIILVQGLCWIKLAPASSVC